MEYLPTDLPKYMKTTSREAVANSPVEAGHVLLFSEDGTSLTAKKSDGSFESVGGGSNVVAGYIRNNNGALTFCEAGKLEGGAVSQITVSGAGTAAANGIYTTNSAVTGINRTWRNKSTGCSIAANVHAVDKSEAWWSIWDSNGSPLYSSSTFNLISGDPETSPWDLSWNASAEASPAPSVSHTMVYPTGSAGDTVAQLRISETLKPAPDYAGRAASTKKATDINPTINQTKYITPALAKIKDYTPVLKIGEEYFVNGIGGDFIPGGEFYKCSALVAASEGGVQGQTISFHGVCQMDGMTPETADLSFTMEDAAKTGWERTWLSSDGTLRLQGKVYMEDTEDTPEDETARTWFITQASDSTTNVWEASGQGGSDGPTDPWGQTDMMYNGNGLSYNLTWTVSEASEATPASWSGYKATQGDDGKYSFADTATTGLSYSKVKPVVGGIYTEDALVKILDMYTGLPVDGLVLFAPLGADNATANTGQVLTASNPSKVSYTTYKGIACVKLNGTYITAETGTVSVSPMTVSIWAAPLVAQKALWCSGSSGSPMMYYSSGNEFRLYSPDTAIGTGAIGDWHHCVWSIPSSGNSIYYFDGVAIGSVKTYETGTMNNIRIGYRNSDQPAWNGYLAGFRIYNRVLSAAEVAALYAEYLPTE